MAVAVASVVRTGLAMPWLSFRTPCGSRENRARGGEESSRCARVPKRHAYRYPRHRAAVAVALGSSHVRLCQLVVAARSLPAESATPLVAAWHPVGIRLCYRHRLPLSAVAVCLPIPSSCMLPALDSRCQARMPTLAAQRTQRKKRMGTPLIAATLRLPPSSIAPASGRRPCAPSAWPGHGETPYVA